MAKKIESSKSKVSKKSKFIRKSSIQYCIEDAQSFLKPKKIRRKSTMAFTIQQGKKILSAKKKSIQIKKKKRVSIKAKPAKKSKPAKKTAQAKGESKSKTSKVIIPATLPPSTGSSLIRAPSRDRSTKPTKATIFKTSTNSNLPLPAFGFIDVCFCVDATGSMSSQIAQVQSTIVAIIKKIQTKVRTEGITLRFAVVTYRDHPPQQSTYVTKYQDFSDAEETIKYVNNLRATGGGDFPEAVHDGLIDACQKLTWIQLPGTPTLRYIFHVADAPPHGKQFLTGQTKQGCTCGKTTASIFHEINVRQIHYRLIKARMNTMLDEMQRLFKASIVNFDSTVIAGAHEMDIKVSDMIIHEILPPS